MNQAKILVVEDEMLVAEDIAGRLKRLGYDVTDIVESGEEAIASVLKNPPDLVLMDIILGGELDGIETVEAIHQHQYIPVVYLTAYGDKKTLNRSKITEPLGYITKPFDEQQLNITIEIALNKYQGENKLRKSLIDSEKYRQVTEESLRVKNQYISMISHELRQPISQILLSAETLEVSQEKFDMTKKKQYLQFIQNAAENMDEMVENLLFIGRSENGKIEIERQPIELAEFCQQLIEQLQLNPNQDSRIRLAIAPETPDRVLLDKKLLHHILTNLLANALKYSSEEGQVSFVIFTEEDYESSLKTGHQQLIIQVQDSGIGIPKEDMKNLFDPFHRCSNVQNIKGNGLGLSIVKKAVELQAGSIQVDSEVGVGTTFTIRLPLVRGK